MLGKAISKIAPRQDVCLFCALRFGRTPEPLYRQRRNQTRSYRASTPSNRPPAAAYAVAEEDPDESPQSFHQPSPSPPKTSSSAWPVFVPKRPTTKTVEPETRPHKATPAPAPPESSNWKCSLCGNLNLARRRNCTTCEEPKSGPVRNHKAETQKVQQNWGQFATQRAGSTGGWRTEGRQRQQLPDVARPILQADRERPAWRPRVFRQGDGRGKDPEEPRESSRSPFRRIQVGERLYEEADRTDSYPFRGDQRKGWQERDYASAPNTPFNSPQQLFRSRENNPSREGGIDTGTQAGMDALLQYTAEVMKRSPSSPRPSEGPNRAQTWRSRDTMPQIRRSRNTTPWETTNAGYPNPESRTASPVSVFDDVVSETPTTLPDPLLNGEEDIFGTRKRRHRGRFDETDQESYGEEVQRLRGRFQERDEETYEEESRRTRGRLQSDSEQPQIAEVKVEPRLDRKAGRRASTRQSSFRFDDPDEELLLGRKKKKSKGKSKEKVSTRTPIQLPEFISVENLATALRVRTDVFISRMEDMGFDRPRHDHVLDAETSGLIASEFNFEATHSQETRSRDLVAPPIPEDVSSLPSRPPIVTIMGHVDHGKTTILDWLRKSSVVESEHGGITQHIGAFSVTMPGGKQITFLDTPGHAAFLDMRRRGANVTDIVILVVAADDSVKPQTLEAIKHATDAKVPIIVAINKVDKEDANVDRVKKDLARHGITVEEYGGEVQAIPVSGKLGSGMADLEEATVTLSELLDHRAEIDGAVQGWIIESKVTVAGRVATILVRRGTLRPGDIIVAGTTWARVRTLRNDAGALVNEASPGTPVQIDGWRGDDPIAGWEVLQAEDEDHAKDVVELRQEREEYTKLAGDTAAINVTRTEEAEARAKVLAWEAEQEWASKKGRKPKDNAGWVEGRASGGPKQVHFVVKADVSGSVEAVVNSVSAIGNNEVAANVVRSGVGVINESDVQHLASSGELGYLISFNQPVDANVSRLAEAAGLSILDYNIIYKVTDVVREKLSAELPPLITQKVVGEAEIGKTFEISVKKGTTRIAGCKISNGTISRDKKIRVLRGTKVIYDGTLHSLKNIKKDVTEMRKGSECGMGFENWEGFREGDQIQSYEKQKTPRTL